MVGTIDLPISMRQYDAFQLHLMMSVESNDKNEQGILLGIEEEMLISPHYHLNLYQTFLRTSSPNDFQLSIITLFDDECYKNYLEENVKSIGRAWNKWINSKPVISKWQVKKCSPSYVDCDRSRWEMMIDLYNENEQKNESASHHLYTHLDPDYFLLRDFSTIKWMSDCRQFGIAFRQMSNNFHVPWISMSHACVSHRLIQSLTPELILRYLDEHKDMQIALYAIVETELFDGVFSDLLHFSEIGSVYSERIGRKIEKPNECTEQMFNPPTSTQPIASIHLKSCKRNKEYQLKCLERIRQFNTTGVFSNWNFNISNYTNLKGSSMRSFH